jgi:hypothetical protein
LALNASDVWVCVSPINLGPALFEFDADGGVNAIVVWDKKRPGLGYQWIRRQCEFILFKTTRKKPKNAASEFDLWSLSTDDPKTYQHAAQKPVELIRRAFHLSPGQLVADPFVGSGATLVACEQTGRLGRGMEIEPKYVGVTLERLAGMGLHPRLCEG